MFRICRCRMLGNEHSVSVSSMDGKLVGLWFSQERVPLPLGSDDFSNEDAYCCSVTGS